MTRSGYLSPLSGRKKPPDLLSNACVNPGQVCPYFNALILCVIICAVMSNILNHESNGQFNKVYPADVPHLCKLYDTSSGLQLQLHQDVKSFAYIYEQFITCVYYDMQMLPNHGNSSHLPHRELSLLQMASGHHWRLFVQTLACKGPRCKFKMIKHTKSNFREKEIYIFIVYLQM